MFNVASSELVKPATLTMVPELVRVPWLVSSELLTMVPELVRVPPFAITTPPWPAEPITTVLPEAMVTLLPVTTLTESLGTGTLPPTHVDPLSQAPPGTFEEITLHEMGGTS